MAVPSGAMLRRVPLPHEDEDLPARRDFHLALAGVVFPFASFVLSAMLAWKNARAPRTAGQASWTRRLVGLAALDFLVMLSLVALTAGKLPAPAVPAPPGPRVGVVLDPSDRGQGAEVLSVLSGSPADRAGIRPGDAVTAVDGQPIRSNVELTATMGATRPGQARSLTLRRGDVVLDVSAVPTAIADLPPEPTPLFEPEGPQPPLRGNLVHLGAAWGAAVGLLAVVALLAARRAPALAPSPLGLWLAFAGTLALANLALVATTLVVARVVGGSSLGGGLLGIFAGSGVMLAVAAAWRARLRSTGALAIEPRRAPAPRTVVMGMGYILAGLPRVGLVLAAATTLLHLPSTDPGAEIRELVHPGVSPAAVGVLVIAAVILAPLGEETLFRGVLLPWLRRFLSPDAAAWASAWIFAAGHLRYGPSVLVVVVYGLALAWARMHTGRLRAPIAMHMLINAVAMAVTLIHG